MYGIYIYFFHFPVEGTKKKKSEKKINFVQETRWATAHFPV